MGWSLNDQICIGKGFVICMILLQQKNLSECE